MKYNSRLSKYDLCKIFGLVSPSGQANYRELKVGYLTADVLKEMGIKEADYRKIRRFTRVQTLALIRLLEIEPDDLKLINSLSRAT